MSSYFYSTTFSLLLYVCVLLTYTNRVKGDVSCIGGPKGSVTFPNFDPPVPTAVAGTNNCPLPTQLDPNIYYVSPTQTQKRPWDSSDLTISGPGNGWALDQRTTFGCMVGGFCPYACKAPYIESQYDNLMGIPWVWTMSCAGRDVFVGAGRRTITCGASQSGQTCAGGEQGLYCDTDNVAKIKSPSSTSAPFYTSACIASAPGIEVENLTPWEISACRPHITNYAVPQIPTTISPSAHIQLAAPPRNSWWTAGQTQPMTVLHYFMIPTKSADCLNPKCQRIAIRPSTNQPSIAGFDYTPYILSINPSANLLGYSVNIAVNSDAYIGADPQGRAYDGSLGNPGYGVKIYDVDGKLVCNAYWTGPPTRSDCNTICRGDRCANKACTGAECGQAPPDCSKVSCLSTPVEPHLITGDGTHLTGSALRQTCGTFYNFDANAGKKIRIELYTTDNSAPTPVTPSPTTSSSTTSSASSASTSSSTTASTTASTSSSTSSTSTSSSTSSTSTTSSSLPITSGTGGSIDATPTCSSATTNEGRRNNRIIEFVNKCSQTVWVGAQGNPLPRNGGWELKAGHVDTLTVPDTFRAGRFWPRTNCQTLPNGEFKCETGDCGRRKECAGIGGDNPSTLAEFTLDPFVDYYDISVVDGYSVGVQISPISGRCKSVNNPHLGQFNCGATKCVMNGAKCPPELRKIVGNATYCMSICAAVNDPYQRPKHTILQNIYNNIEQRYLVCCACGCGDNCGCESPSSKYCCSPFNKGATNEKGGRCYVEQWPTPTPGDWPNRYDLIFKNQCPNAYSWQFDDFKSTYQCVNSDYRITFCP